jgi:tetratricopeptide (TPR) repeat protein
MPAAQQQVGLPPRYRVVRHIANGGMASVWAAEDSVLERLVAIKVLASGYAADPSARRRFTREARAAARVSDHPHVVTIFDTGEHDGVAFIVMELLAGGSLADRLRLGEPVPTPTAVRWLREAASALDAAHAAHIVHRDVKPGNLLLDEHGRLAVGDFGIASLADDTSLTQAGQVLGTAAYLSPEQARGNPATPASDRYSLAVVAYELLCGRKPFDGDTPVAQARAHAEVDPPMPTGPCEAAAGALKHGLAKDPARRPPTATAFVDELDAALGDHTDVTHVLPIAGARRFARLPATPVPAPAAVPAAEARAAEPGPPMPAPRAALTPPRRPAPAAADAPPGRARRGTGAWLLGGLAALALAGGAGGAALLASNHDDGDGTASRSTSSAARASSGSTAHKAKKHKKSSTTAAAASAAASTPTTATSGAAAASPSTTTTSGAGADTRSALELNNAGYALLPGDPQQAVPLLQRSVEKFRADGATNDLNYAYALYNLGWALRLAGRPAEAIPYLQERLNISNYKRGIVEKELKTAQQQAGR